ncbi:NADPH:quinone oxidoreductase family protein [Acidimicrobiia bacterium]|jgi:NADPH2:quinone reductase|nr:NADPH:quinone oxidoreductase family protein [Acidimicrobiia bacterium]MDA7850576.1 NADPH:quinone oxidoreductase family protein [Acidimicrobiaceae bacterium]MDA8719321.1 NADPH:quinone oxidoreductase family protein [Candidatus Actinomarina sp.]MDA8813444.1 NADPH:quinone oxidoreductase family protein [Candidatus Actinomarina sp.]MDA8964149.1 NADPH:quinone oxidoreductase family protein [Acidimicrobiia bacterium]|tara:strand:- start:90 stop:1061 length:972 start_codon:yes stop_codon:yes gene_type:complete
MKSVVCTKLGEPKLLEIKEVDKPIPLDDEVLIKVEAAGVNYPDALLVQGKYQIVVEPPFTPGNEVCGYVDQVGKNVDLKKGTKVIGLPEIGGFSEFVCINKKLVIPISDNINSLAGASLPINYGTTYYALKRRAKAASGESLLILGASGGVGTASIQLGKILGLTTIAAIGSDEKEEYVKNLGVDHIIRYDKENLKESAKKLTDGKGVDIVVDPVGGNVTEEALRATAWNGRLLVIGFAQGEIPKIPLNITLVKGVSIVGVWWGRWTQTSPKETAEDFNELIGFINEGKLDINPKNVYSIEEVSTAMDNFLNRKNIGKTVIKF